MNLKKHQLIDGIAQRSGCTRTQVREVLGAAVEETMAAIAQGHEVMLFGLGKLRVSNRAPRKARNLHTGEPVMVPSRTAVLFQASTGLLKAANDANA